MWVRVGVVFLAVTVLIAGCTAVKSGTPLAGPSTSDVAGGLKNAKPVDLRTSFNETQQSVNDYWNSDRIKNARPRQPAENGSGGSTVTDEPTGIKVDPTDGPLGAIPHSTGQVSDGRPWSKVGLTRPTLGRLYFQSGGENHVCSASVVNSSSGTLVATAAHCVWDTQGGTGWSSNFMFVPADENNLGVTPFGKWVPEFAYAPPQFRQNAFADDMGAQGDGWAYDIAFLRMRPQNGKTIEQALGGQGIAFGIPAEGLTVIGYPTAPPFDGKVERFCASATWKNGYQKDYLIDCVMTPGSSGGGWFTRLDLNRGAGYLVSVTSIGSNRGVMGAQLGKVAHDLYQQADAGR